MKPEFSRPVAAARINQEPGRFEISASPDECQALAQRFDLISIQTLKAQVLIRTLEGDQLYRFEADLQADLVQTCVVTLEPVEQHIEAKVALNFATLADTETEAVVDFDPEGEDPPDPIIDGKIDMGEVIAEHLALELDSFPRVQGAALEKPETGAMIEIGEPARAGPLANLGKLLAEKK